MGKFKFSQKVFRSLFALTLLFNFTKVFAQEQSFESIKNYIEPAKKTGGLKISDYFLWCPSVIKVGDTYHLFASAWPAELGLNGWTTQSLLIRATSKDLLGPYVFQEEVFKKRDGFWDSERVHNPKIVKSGNKFIIYYISTANETGYAKADKVTGPWVRSEKKMMSFSNPAPIIKSDGSVYVFGRLSVRKGENDIRTARAFTAPNYKGPYTDVAPDAFNLLPKDYELEDPTIWWANNQYNMICTDFAGKATGKSKVGLQYYSKDGINYQLLTKEPVNTHTITFDDGTTEKFRRVERPFVYTNSKGEVLAYFLGCMTLEEKGFIVAHPVKNYYPGRSASTKNDEKIK